MTPSRPQWRPGRKPFSPPVERSWGGYSGYFADPEGHRWELAWAPWFTTFDE